MTVQLRVDLGAFGENLRVLRDRVAPAELMLVVKNDAYGHGVERILPRALEEGVTWVGAFDVATGRRVRRLAGDEIRVFMWMLPDADDVAEAIDLQLDLGVGDAELLEDAAAAARRAATTARVHLKIDSGLRRNGIRPEEWETVVRRARRLEEQGVIEVIGLWSHIAEASDADDDDARAIFDRALTQARDAGLTPALTHLAASSAASARAEFRYDLVRIGAFAYGVAPAGGPSARDLGLRPIGTLTAAVTAVDGERVHVDAGFLHGLPTALGGAADVGTPAGRRPLLAVEPLESVVAGWGGAAPGDTVLLYGGEAGEPTATEWAESIGTIGEEIVTRISPRVERTSV
ncbi:alanine racemase [Microbacterium sp. 1P10UB]|uniref:alanine racemase n=1 Tax=unclassified Microbacterium TaxID=2609290 RepID=UPI0039A31E69